MEPVQRPQDTPQHSIKSSFRAVTKREAKVGKAVGTVPSWSVELARGKDKILYHRPADASGEVYMVPRAGFLDHRKKTLNQEVAFCKGLKTALKRVEGETNLEIDIKTEEGKAPSKAKAQGNLEKLARGQSFEQAKARALQLVNGMKNLHAAGAVHADIKLENILLFPNEVVRISDFGKAVKVKQDQEKIPYSGNTRYGPPEGSKSKAGDVYGTAIALIRMLEEPFLSDANPTLLSVDSKDQKTTGADETRRGIEKYMLDHKAFVRTAETKGTGFKGRVKDFICRVLTVTGRISPKALENEQRVLHAYIDALVSKVGHELNKKQREELDALLKNMTNIDPKQREPMNMCYARLKNLVFNEKPS